MNLVFTNLRPDASSALPLTPDYPDTPWSLDDMVPIVDDREAIQKVQF